MAVLATKGWLTFVSTCNISLKLCHTQNLYILIIITIFLFGRATAFSQQNESRLLTVELFLISVSNSMVIIIVL